MISSGPSYGDQRHLYPASPVSQLPRIAAPGAARPGMPLTDGNSSVPWKPHASPSLRLPKDHKLWVHIPQADCTSSAIRRVEILIAETLNSEHDELKREGERGEAADRYVPFNPNQNGTIHGWDPISICNKICHNRLIKKNKKAEELIKGSLEVKQAAIQKYYNRLPADPSLTPPLLRAEIAS